MSMYINFLNEQKSLTRVFSSIFMQFNHFLYTYFEYPITDSSMKNYFTIKIYEK